MNLPEPIKTNITDESFAGVTYHIRGALVPELQVELTGEPVMFEHHTLLWKQTGVKIELRKLPGGVKRKIAGLDFFVTGRVGPGRIAFSRDWPGQCIPLHLSAGRGAQRARAPVPRRDRQPRLQLRARQGRAQHAARRRRASSSTSSGPTDGDAVVWVQRPGQRLRGGAGRRRADRRRGRRLALQGRQRQARVGLARA